MANSNPDVSPALALSPGLDLSALASHAQAAEALLKALANGNRLMILCALLEGELSVGELNLRIPLSQSALSQHLATLRRGGQVICRRDAQMMYYRISDPKVTAVIKTLHALFCMPET